MMQIVISALHFDWPNMAECLRRARNELGLDGVELSWDRAFERPHCTREDLAQLESAQRDSGSALSAHVWLDPARPDGSASRDELLDWLATSRVTGVTHLVLHGGRSDDRRAGIARVRRVLESVLPAYERAGVVLCLENHYAYDYHGGHELFSEPWEFREVLSLDSPSLGVCFDTGHGHMTRNSLALIRELGPWLRYVHLADNQGIDDDHAMYRKGTVAWDTVFAALRAGNFDGTFCVEFPVREDRQPFQRCVADIRALWRG